jgi:3-deoxy-manno-octulosonate cytidylyltransferase (CMP-KDO synthetase)
MKTAIVIPARYASTRFPGKPLALINGRSMLSRVVDVARNAARQHSSAHIYITTEDERIADHAQDLGVECILTTADCATGSDRVWAAVQQIAHKPDFIINLQGDAPFTPPEILTSLISFFNENQSYSGVVTPVHELSWNDLDQLRDNKKTTPFSGTTVLRYQTGPQAGYAFAFSKQIIPSIRNEDTLRKTEPSPVTQHIGVYGYSYDALEKFVSLPPSRLELIEGLEQMRCIENNLPIFTLKIKAPRGSIHTGIDTPEDLARAQDILS